MQNCKWIQKTQTTLLTGDREYQFGKGKETMADDDKTTFNSLISALKELTTGQKEMMSTFRQMREKNGPTPHSPLFPNSDQASSRQVVQMHLFQSFRG